MYILVNPTKRNLQAHTILLENPTKDIQKKKTASLTRSLPEKGGGNAFQLILWIDHHSDTKAKDNIKKEKYTPGYLMNLNVKTINTILTNQIQRPIKPSAVYPRNSRLIH